MSNARRIVVAALVALSSGGVCTQGERPAGVPEIVIDKERMCPVVDGEPFFAIGACNIGPQQMKVAAAAAFNLIIRWSGQSGFGSGRPRLAKGPVDIIHGGSTCT